MKHIWSILCQNSSVDSSTNLLSIFNCIEELGLSIDKNKISQNSNLVIPISFQLVSFWLIKNKNIKNILEIKVELFDPDGNLLNEFNKNFDVASGHPRFRSIININGIKVTKNGGYFIKVSQKNDDGKFKVVAELPIDIKITY